MAKSLSVTIEGPGQQTDFPDQRTQRRAIFVYGREKSFEMHRNKAPQLKYKPIARLIELKVFM